MGRLTDLFGISGCEVSSVDAVVTEGLGLYSQMVGGHLLSLVLFGEKYLKSDIYYIVIIPGTLPTTIFKGVKAENISGYSQAAYLPYGNGKIVVSGEAAMFTGQFGAGLSWQKVGLNSPKAKNNYKLLLNIIHWLDTKLPG